MRPDFLTYSPQFDKDRPKCLSSHSLESAMPAHIAVLGDGAWGTAIALLLARIPGYRVTLFSPRPERCRVLREQRENKAYLPGVSIPAELHLSSDWSEVQRDLALAVSAIPTVYLRTTLQGIGGKPPQGVPVLSLSKGLEIDTFKRPSEIVREIWGSDKVAILSGPSHAEEVSRGLPTTVVAASRDLELARWIQQLLSSERFRVYTNLDAVGVEVAGALKNILGLAAGICDGLAFGDNAKAALLTRGLVEMARLGVMLGGANQTFYGLAGLGDVITTCFSRYGRNRLVGERLGRGEKLKTILAGMSMVAEGVYTARAVYARTEHMGVAMPITREVYRVLYEDKNPQEAVRDLMLREPTSEGAQSEV